MILRNLVTIVIIVVIYLLASSPGWDGKIFALIIVAIILWWYMRKEKKAEVMNPVVTYYNNLVLLCKLNASPDVGMLILTGDHYDQQKFKGKVLGHITRDDQNILTKVVQSQLEDENGKPVFNKDKTPVMVGRRVSRRVPKPAKDAKADRQDQSKPDGFVSSRKSADFQDPRKIAHIFLYTPQWGGIFNIPLLGMLFSMMWRREYLFCAYGHQLESQHLIGDVLIKGCNTRFVGMMEFINDDNLDPDHEMAILSEEVDRLTLEDELSLLPRRIRMAVDGNSEHLRMLDGRDDNLRG